MTRSDLSDGDREILAELEADARASAEDVDELLERYGNVTDVLGELLDSLKHMPDELDGYLHTTEGW